MALPLDRMNFFDPTPLDEFRVSFETTIQQHMKAVVAAQESVFNAVLKEAYEEGYAEGWADAHYETGMTPLGYELWRENLIARLSRT